MFKSAPPQYKSEELPIEATSLLIEAVSEDLLLLLRPLSSSD
jgi:hypothetical protein